METIVKIPAKTIHIHRQLMCDLCDRVLFSDSCREKVFYAVFYREQKHTYLEKYICESCFRHSYPLSRVVDLDSAEDKLRSVLERDFKRDWYCIVTPCSSEKEWKLLQENPFLLELWGEKI